MQIAFHLGAFSTDVDHLLTTLAANPAVLAEHGIWIPQPTTFRNELRDIAGGLNGAQADDITQEKVLDLCMSGAPYDVRRLILTQGNFLSAPDRVITTKGLYANAGDRVAQLVNLFPDDELSFFMATINPAMLLANMVQRQGARRSYDDILAGQPPETLLWAPVLSQITGAARNHAVYAWNNEDGPALQPDLARLMAGLPHDTVLQNGYTLFEQITRPEGTQALLSALEAEPDMPDQKRHNLVAQLIAQHFRPEAIETEIAMPGWNETLLQLIENTYEEDTDEMTGIRGLTFVCPE